MKKQSFITGAIILMAANAISKILGAVFKIPLTYILNEEGMAVYSTAFQVYIMFLSFVISGFPFAVSKTVAETVSVGDMAKAGKIVRLSTLILSVIGAAGSVLLYIFAPFLALAMKEPSAVVAIRVISPSVFFVALGAGYKSYFQGISNMIPVAISQVIEAIIKLLAGYALALYFVKYGTILTSAGAISGVTVGEVLATLMLFVSYAVSKKERTTEKYQNRPIIREVFNIALPLLFMSVAGNALGIAETAITRGALIGAGLEADEARFLYGAYSGYALTVFHLPSGILATMGVSILPVIAGAAASGNMERARIVTELGIRLTILLSLPCAVVMYMMSNELLNTLFNNTSSALMLKCIAPCIIPLCVTQLITAALQSAGKLSAPFFIGSFVSVIRLILCAVLTRMPDLNIYGTALSALICGFLLMILEYMYIKRFLCLKFNISEIIIKPIAAAAVMAGTVYIAKDFIGAYTGNGRMLFFAVCAIALGAYTLMLFLTEAVNVFEIRKMFKM